MHFHPHGWAAGPCELRRKSRLNPFGINRPWKCGFHLHGWAAGPWELTTPVQVRGMIQVLAAYRIQGFCWCCFSDSSIAFRNCSTAATCGESNEPFAMYRHTGDVSSGYSPPPRYTSKVSSDEPTWLPSCGPLFPDPPGKGSVRSGGRPGCCG